MKSNLKISCEGNDLIFALTLPKNRNRMNPYMEEESEKGELGIFPTVTGLIDDQAQSFGFAFTIDMDYKDKTDQCSSEFLNASMFLDKQEFVQICETQHFPMYQITSPTRTTNE